MRLYMIDELAEDIPTKLHKTLQDMELQSALPGVYWLPVPTHLYSALQQEHHKECGPYVMALEVEADSVRLELLVRGQGVLHCSCVGYATPELEQHMMRSVDELVECR